jgi:uncharacterized integral membrane protein
MNIKTIMSVLLAALSLIFIIQNFAVIEVSFLFWTLSISSSVLMFLILLIGFILGRLLHNYSFNSIKKIINEGKKAE